MNNRRTQASLLVMLTAGLSGCATLLSGTSQTVTVDSYPPGAKVALGLQTGTTPASFVVPKGRDCPVQISQGPDKRVVILRRRMDPVTLLNVIPPLWPGFVVDWATGALTKFDPDVVSVDFRSTNATQAQLTASQP